MSPELGPPTILRRHRTWDDVRAAEREQRLAGKPSTVQAARRGSSEKQLCSLRVYASRWETLLSIGRRPRLANLYAEVEQVQGDSFRSDWRITNLIRHSRTCGAPDPGVVSADAGPEFAALEAQVRAALKLKPRKEADLARTRGRDLCGDCAAQP